jgi:hypothetical protein
MPVYNSNSAPISAAMTAAATPAPQQGRPGPTRIFQSDNAGAPPQPTTRIVGGDNPPRIVLPNPISPRNDKVGGGRQFSRAVQPIGFKRQVLFTSDAAVPEILLTPIYPKPEPVKEEKPKPLRNSGRL